MGEWSASFDTLVCTKLDDVMDSYAETGRFLEFDRKIPEKRMRFLRNFVEAQMVVYESGPSSGWFYWNYKMEGGGERVIRRTSLLSVSNSSASSSGLLAKAFAEWDYLRGIREGWIPVLPPSQPALDAFGTCESIIFRTNDDISIVHEFPDPETVAPDWQAVTADDDVVVTHGDSLTRGPGASDLNKDIEEHEQAVLLRGASLDVVGEREAKADAFGICAALGFLVLMFWLARCALVKRRVGGYISIPSTAT